MPFGHRQLDENLGADAPPPVGTDVMGGDRPRTIDVPDRPSWADIW